MTGKLARGNGAPTLHHTSFLTRLKKSIRRYWILYLMLIVPVAYIIVFAYVPMYGIQIAFRDFSIRKGYWDSPWVGLKHFKNFFNGFFFWQLLRNTFVLNLLSLLADFTLPILFALMLNELKGKRLKKTVQTISYIPHFISVVIVISMINQMFSNFGIVNNIRMALGAGSRVSFFTQEEFFRPAYILSGVWQGLGYSSIIYVAALAKVDVELYEAARMDGANRLQKIIHIDIPCIIPTMTILLILSISRLMNIGFEKIFLLQNPTNLNVSRVISTYVYEVGIQGGQYSFSTAVGLFNSVVGTILLVLANTFARTVSENSLW